VFYWVLRHILAGPLLHLVYRPRVLGASQLPRTGPVILASNHMSFIDPVVLPLVVDRRVHFLAASNYYSGRGLGGWAVRRFLLATGMIPIDRSGGKASEASLQAGRAVLAKGKVLGIYPEGSRSRDGRLHRGRTGIARLVLEGHAAVVPVAMIGTDQVIPVGSGSVIPRIRPITVRFGAPLDFSEHEGEETDHAVLRSITDRIMRAIHDLGEQEYVDEYTTKSREG
jgi:1-acyl-sn-glycerol-3-phosphate acyltransferase